MCYTSGTTGNPKGVRVLAPLQRLARHDARCCPMRSSLASRDSIMPVVPMFHANAWGMPYSAAADRARLVYARCRRWTAESIYELLDTEKVTITAAVPTVWLMLLRHMEDERRQAAALSRAS